MNATSALYLDTSALVKMVLEEENSEALRCFLAGTPEFVSSEIARVELVRAVTRHRPDQLSKALEVLRKMRLVLLDRELLESAAGIQPLAVRSLDAIHLASALQLDAAVVTYDARMQDAAQGLGLAVIAPA
jgi:uncharacterized protein